MAEKMPDEQRIERQQVYVWTPEDLDEEPADEDD